MSQCRSCRAKIIWVGTEHGKAMPLDRQPYEGDDPRGLFVLRGDVAVAVTLDAFPDEPHFRSHFATCPNATRHRKARW